MGSQTTVVRRGRGGARGMWARVAGVLVLVAGLVVPGAGARAAEAVSVPGLGRVVTSELPLPPTAPSGDAGACSAAVNPHGTGCIDSGPDAMTGVGRLPDSRYVLVSMTFAGAPAAPEPGSAYSGQQIVVVRTDGGVFPDGDAWKCLTCGVPSGNEAGLNADVSTYPQGFPDGERVLMGANILDCAPYQVTDPACTPDKVHIYPIRWNVTADGSGAGGSIRELRLNPDGVHLGWNHLILSAKQFDEFAFMGRLVFDAHPTTGTPLVPRYDLASVTTLFNAAPQYQPYQVESGNRLVYTSAGMIGEFRGWSSDGLSALGIQSYQSDSVDAFETSNATGASRPLTRDAQYVDPIQMSPDGQWTLAEELAGTGRMAFLSAMRGVPPLTDQLPTTGFVSGLHDNGVRRFFLPYLVNTGTGSTYRLGYDDDPNWNARADPSWLADGSGVIWWEGQVTSPACGGKNPLPCPVSAEPGGRRSRLIISRFPDRTPQPVHTVAPVPDTVAWGTPYTPGQALPVRPHLPAGTYTVIGKAQGQATVTITENAAKSSVTSIQVSYRDYSDDGEHIINGTERATAIGPQPIALLNLRENLTLTGAQTGTKRTGLIGLTLSPLVENSDWQVLGTLTTTIDGRTYSQPANGT